MRERERERRNESLNGHFPKKKKKEREREKEEKTLIKDHLPFFGKQNLQSNFVIDNLMWVFCKMVR